MKVLKPLSLEERSKANPALLDIISYRKSGLSLNHIIGCSLDCAYCVRHFFDNFSMKTPKLICSDKEAVDQLVNHRFFIPNVTPIQIFNRATDPFLSGVKNHTHKVLKMLDNKGFTNLILLITRANVSKEDVDLLEELQNLKVTVLVTYSGINNAKLEPISTTNITTNSIKTISENRNRIKLILYWRPIVEGWNDNSSCFDRVFDMAQYVDAIVYTGYYHRPENYEYLKGLNLEPEYQDFERRKFLPNTLERRILDAYSKTRLKVPLFRKTSCGVTYAHHLPDYNGHWGVNEICDICPSGQREKCAVNYKNPSDKEFHSLLTQLDYETTFLHEKGHFWTENLGEEKRYHIQHILGYQIWDIDKPHFKEQHGRSTFGQKASDANLKWYNDKRHEFYNEVIKDDD